MIEMKEAEETEKTYILEQKEAKVTFIILVRKGYFK